VECFECGNRNVHLSINNEQSTGEKGILQEENADGKVDNDVLIVLLNPGECINFPGFCFFGYPVESLFFFNISSAFQG
jgi:hypothetical protein